MERTVGRLKAGEHVTIVALGDSNTERTFHTQGRLNWVGLLAEAVFEMYGNGICTLINAGKCGSTAADALGRLDRDVLRFTPDLVIIALGMNDACGGETALADFRCDLRTVIVRIREACGSELLLRTPNPVVTCHGLPLPTGQPLPGRPWEGPQRPLRAYSEAIVDLAQEMACPVVDHYALWCGKRWHVAQPVADPTGLWPRMSDAIHPGPLGHMVFYRELAPLFGLSPRFPWEGLD